MKKFSLLILPAALLAGFASRREQQPAPANQKYFIYTAYPSDSAIDLGNPANYELTANDGNEVPFCSGVAHRCAVLGEDDGTGRPNFARPYTILTRS